MLENPEKYIGQFVVISRFKKHVKATLCSVKEGFFDAAWFGQNGKPISGIVPFKEVENQLKGK